MYFINWKHQEEFNYCIFCWLFLNQYNDFEFYKYCGKNVFLVEKNGEKTAVFLFSYNGKKARELYLKYQCQIKVYYLNKTNFKTKITNDMKIEYNTLSDEYIEKYNKYIENPFVVFDEDFMRQNKQGGLKPNDECLFKYFSGEYLKKYNKYIENPFVVFDKDFIKQNKQGGLKFSNKSLYKYFSEESSRAEERLKGEVSFSDPNEFNDPFDCDIEIISDVEKINLLINSIIQVLIYKHISKEKINDEKKQLEKLESKFQEPNQNINNFLNLILKEHPISYFTDEDYNLLGAIFDEYISAYNDIKNKFRVLSLAHKYDNILMWSYYGHDHKGYCLEYKFIDIINALIKKKGFCYYGDVDYKRKRPIYKIRCNSKLNYSIINSLVSTHLDCLFTKFIDWKHENEFRFIVIPYDDNEENKSPYYTINVKAQNVYRGCNSDPLSIGFNEIKLKKDNIKYKLKI